MRKCSRYIWECICMEVNLCYLGAAVTLLWCCCNAAVVLCKLRRDSCGAAVVLLWRCCGAALLLLWCCGAVVVLLWCFVNCAGNFPRAVHCCCGAVVVLCKLCCCCGAAVVALLCKLRGEFPTRRYCCGAALVLFKLCGKFATRCSNTGFLQCLRASS